MIAGTAVFGHLGQVANLSYSLICDEQWASTLATITGWIGPKDFHMTIERDRDKHWCVDGEKIHVPSGLQDIDLGFTPASNTIAIRRLSLSVGEQAKTVALWLDTDDWTVKPLRQRYRCIENNVFGYSSPQHDYHATITVNDFGVVTDYPKLWAMVNRLNGNSVYGGGAPKCHYAASFRWTRIDGSFAGRSGRSLRLHN